MHLPNATLANSPAVRAAPRCESTRAEPSSRNSIKAIFYRPSVGPLTELSGFLGSVSVIRSLRRHDASRIADANAPSPFRAIRRFNRLVYCIFVGKVVLILHTCSISGLK